MRKNPARTGWLAQWRYAHRGLHDAGRAENSLGAATAAIARGLGIECDVQLSADGRPVVFHDWELDRLTAETGPVLKRSASQLALIPLMVGGEPIPTLDQLLSLVDGRVPVLIEIKSRTRLPVAPICSAVKSALAGYQGHHAVMSFDPRVSRWFARWSPDTVRGMVVTQENDKGLLASARRSLAFRAARADILACDVRDLPSPFVAHARRAGIPVLSWTVSNAELARRAALYADAPIAEGEGLDE